MKKFLFILLAAVAIQGCASKEVDKGIRSPCVSANLVDAHTGESLLASVPCGPRRSANAPWLG